MRKRLHGFQPGPTQTGCTAKEDGRRLEISDLESRGIVLCSKNKGADQLHSYRSADSLCFGIYEVGPKSLWTAFEMLFPVVRIEKKLVEC